MKQVIEAIAGPDLFQRCIFWSDTCSDSAPYVLHETWQTIRPQVAELMARTTIEDLARSIPMDAADEHTAFWRSGMKRLIAPRERRHLCAFAWLRLAGGIVSAVCGVLTLSFGETYGWAALFLALAALNLAGGYSYITIARSAPPRT